MLKRMLSMLLAVLLVLSAVPVSAMAQPVVPKPRAESAQNPDSGAEGGVDSPDPEGEPEQDPPAEPEGEPEQDPPAEPEGEPEQDPPAEPEGEPGQDPPAEPEEDPVPQEEWDSAQEGQSDPAPELLNLDDLVEMGKLSPKLRGRAALGGGSTILVGDDNEDSARTHQPDKDMDVILSNRSKNYPIEVDLNISREQLPQGSAIMAIKAYDVDEEHGETDEVFLNGTRIGRLSGTNATWNTTILEVPVPLLQEGHNYLHITISDGWVVKIDWIQLLLDGGQKDEALESFDLKLGEPAASDKSKIDLPVTITIQTNTPKTYQTEYTVIDENGDAVAAAFGSVDADGSTEQKTSAQLAMTGVKQGTYKIIGILKTTGENGAPDTIWAQDQVEWYYSGDPDKPAPQVERKLDPSGTCAREVTFTARITPAGDMPIHKAYLQEYSGDIYRELALTPAEGASYTVSHLFQDNKTNLYLVVEWGEDDIYKSPLFHVDNIDITPPDIFYNAITVSEGATDEAVKAAIDGNITITDTAGKDGNLSYAGVKDVTYTWNPEENISSAEEPTLTVKAVDFAGNEATQKIKLHVLAKPLELGDPAVVRVQNSNAFDLCAALESPGDPNVLTIAETGFVWGVMQNPTLTVCNGKMATDDPVTEKGGTIEITAEDIVDGVNYYARCYATDSKGVTYYSKQVSFDIGAKQYGQVYLEASGNTFTAKREGGSEGELKVYYRTVNGSAVGNTHFKHQSGVVTISDGKTASEKITIDEIGVNAVYGSVATTGYSNAARTYQVEIYRVEGGATLKEGATRKTRTMTGHNKIDRDLYEYEAQAGSALTGETIVKPDNFNEGKNAGKVSTVKLSQFSLLNNKAYQPYWQTLAPAGEELQYVTTLEAKEEDKGYQAVQIVSGSTVVNADGDVKKGDISYHDKNGNVKYLVIFEHGDTTLQTGYAGYTFPGGSMPSPGGHLSKLTAHSYANGQSGSYLVFPKNQTAISVAVDAAGSDTADDWYVRNVKHHIAVRDLDEPKAIGVAPMEGTYKEGDTVVVSVIFDEIVDRQNSKSGSQSRILALTSWGSFPCVGGWDTNVLYFEGKVTNKASGGLKLTGIQYHEYIEDMCDGEANARPNFSEATGGGAIDSTKPTITFGAASVSGGTASVQVTVTNGTGQYVWSQSQTMPVNGWQSFKSGDVLKTRQDPGSNWYLHVVATYEKTGANTSAVQQFSFPSDPSKTLPVLSVSVDNTNWAQSRVLGVSYTGENVDKVTMTASDGASKVVKAGDVVVTENGYYAFTLLTTDGDSVHQTVWVEKIDKVPPEMTDLREPTQSSNALPLDKLTILAAFEDDASGIKEVKYRFDGQTEAGYLTAVPGEDGRYTFTYEPQDPDKVETTYLHITVTDNAGNESTFNSSKNFRVQAPATGEMTVSLSEAPADWQKGAVTLTYQIGGSNTAPFTVYGAGSNYDDSALKGEFSVSANGLHSIYVEDARGRTAEGSALVNCIDTYAPTVTDIQVSSEWAQEKTVALVELTDNTTPQYDASGNVTGYSGVGGVTTTYTAPGGEPQEFEDSFTVTVPGTYTITMTDSLGNEAQRTVTIGNIDRVKPTASISRSDDWAQAHQVTLTFQDEAGGSGIASVKTAVVTNKTVPQNLVSQSVTSPVTLTLQDNGEHYVYYQVTDKAGNVTDGFSELFRVDNAAPVITVTQAGPNEPLNAQVDFGSSGGSATWTFDGVEAPLTGPVPVNEKGSYTFKAVSGTGVETVETVSVYELSFQTPADATQVAAQRILAGNKAERPQDPAYTGYTFAKWGSYDFAAPVSGDQTLTAQWTLNAPTVSISVAYGDAPGSSHSYNGSDLVFTAVSSHEAANVSYSYQWYRDNAEAGNGKSLTVTAPGVGSYSYRCEVTANDGTLTSQKAEANATATLAKTKVAIPAADETVFTYDASDKTYGIAANEFYDVAGNVQKAAGEYTVTVTLKDPDNYLWADDTTADKTYDFVIDPAPVTFTIGTPRAPGNGDVHSANVTAKALDREFTEFTFRYLDKDGAEVAKDKMSQVGFYDVCAAVTNTNYCHSATGKQEEQKIGTFEIYDDTPVLTLTQQSQVGNAVVKVEADFKESVNGVLEHSLDGVNYTSIQAGPQELTAKGIHYFRATSDSGVEVVQTVTLYEVTFDTVGTPTERQLIAAKGKVTEPADPKRSGYVFQEWLLDGSSYDFNAEVTEDLALASRWVMDPPAIGSQAAYGSAVVTGPVSYTGEDLVFTVIPSHEGKDITFSYQWQQKVQDLWQDITGEDQAAYTLKAPDVGSYTYRCVVTSHDQGSLSAQETVEASASIIKAVVKRPPESKEIFRDNGVNQTYPIPASSLYTVKNAVHRHSGKYDVIVSLNDKVNYRWDETGLPNTLSLAQRMDYTEDLVYVFYIYDNLVPEDTGKTTRKPAVKPAETPAQKTGTEIGEYLVQLAGVENVSTETILETVQLQSDGSLLLTEPQGLAKPGYQFAGWLYDGEVYPAGSVIRPKGKDVTLTILWEPVPMGVAEPPAPDQTPEAPPAQETEKEAGEPFVILSALLVVVNLLLTAFAWQKDRSRWLCLGLTLAMMGLAFVTGGLAGIVLADLWTIVIAIGTAVCAWLALKKQ